MPTPRPSRRCSQELGRIHVAPELQGYIVDLVDATRHHRDLMLGVEPARLRSRCSAPARALAASVGRHYVVPDDIKALAPSVLEHRLVLVVRSDDARRERRPTCSRRCLESVPVPATASPTERLPDAHPPRMVAGRCGDRPVHRSRILGLVQLAVLALAALSAARGRRACGCDSTRSTLIARRELKERLQVGVDGRVDVTVESTGDPQHPDRARVDDAFDRGRRCGALPARAAGSRRDARAAYRFPTDRRGPLRGRPAARHGRATRSGSRATTRRVLGAEEVIVYPAGARDHVAARRRAATNLDRDMPRAYGRLDPGGEFLNAARLRARRRPASRPLALDRAARPADGAPERSAAPHTGARDARRPPRRATTARRSSARSKACASIVTAVERGGRPSK